MRKLVHLALAARARAAGITLKSGAMLSHSGIYRLNKTATVVFDVSSSILQNHQIEAEEKATIHIGPGVNFRSGAKIYAGPGARILIGAGCFFNHDVSIVAYNEVVIGQNSLFGPYTYISDHNHQFALGSLIKDQQYDTQPLHIGSDVWLGVGATILKGSSLGDGCVVAARAVVNKNIPSNEVWGGIPAKKIGERK